MGANQLLDPRGSPWTFRSISGIAGNGSSLTSSNSQAPEGSQVAFLSGGGSRISQRVRLNAGTYTLGFDAAQSGAALGGSQQFQVLVDNQVVGTFTPGGIQYASYTTNAFTVARGYHTIQFVDTNASTGMAFLDDVTISTSPALVQRGSRSGGHATNSHSKVSGSANNAISIGSFSVSTEGQSSFPSSQTQMQGLDLVALLKTLSSQTHLALSDQLFAQAELQAIGQASHPLSALYLNPTLAGLRQQAGIDLFGESFEWKWLDQVLSEQMT